MRREPGSFRDPESRVVHEGDRVLRELSPRAREDYEAFAASPLAGDGRIVGTRALPGGRLEHDRISFVSYPYEWTFGMLKAAALLQLALLDDAIGHGLSLKDATPYNVQFDGARPVFIDVGSFEPLRGDEPWVAYRQFCTLFLYPLMLTAYRGVSHQPWLRGSLEGIEPADAAALLPRRRGVTVNARLLARLERRMGDTSASETTSRLAKAGYRPEVIRANVRKLRRTVERLEWAPSASTWSTYEADPGKVGFVRAVAARVQPELAWDLGANDGTFSRVVAEHAGLVVAMDSDALVAERLFASLGAGERILPLVVDLADPSPSRGWALEERGDLLTRGRPQLTLSLAVIHHLVITRNVPIPEVLAWLASVGGTHVIEFPHRDDPMVGRLLAAKRAGDTRPDYDLPQFEAALREHFVLLGQQKVLTRTLYEAEAR